jgi:hypothetical protein
MTGKANNELNKGNSLDSRRGVKRMSPAEIFHFWSHVWFKKVEGLGKKFDRDKDLTKSFLRKQEVLELGQFPVDIAKASLENCQYLADALGYAKRLLSSQGVEYVAIADLPEKAETAVVRKGPKLDHFWCQSCQKEFTTSNFSTPLCNCEEAEHLRMQCREYDCATWIETEVGENKHFCSRCQRGRDARSVFYNDGMSTWYQTGRGTTSG